MKIPLTSGSYRLINLIFIAVLLAIAGYSAIFGGQYEHPVPSGSKLLTGEDTISTGLSRSFSAIMKLDFNKAREFNPYGIRIFLFMMIQLTMRVAGFFVAVRRQKKMIILADISISVILFVIFFYPFISEYFRLLFT